MQSKTALLAVSALAGLAFSASAQAAEFVQNGGFESELLPISSEFGSRFPTEQVTNWFTNGYNFVFRPGPGVSGTTADTTGAVNEVLPKTAPILKLWGPGDGSANGLTLSPAGGNFVAAEPQFHPGAISQVINGLVAGRTYDLSFWWAGAQQFGFTGATFEGWDVSLGAIHQLTGNIPNASHGFTGWRLANMTFKATGPTETLSFLATGGPRAAVPPFALLDGVSLTGGAPEPATWAMILVGFGGIGAMVRRRRALAAAATA